MLKKNFRSSNWKWTNFLQQNANIRFLWIKLVSLARNKTHRWEQTLKSGRSWHHYIGNIVDVYVCATNNQYNVDRKHVNNKRVRINLSLVRFFIFSNGLLKILVFCDIFNNLRYISVTSGSKCLSLPVYRS